MNPKKEEPKVEPKNKTAPKNSKSYLSSSNINTNDNTNIITNKDKTKNPKPIKSSKDSRQYNVQLTILDESKQLKINLEIIEGQKPKTVYIKTLNLDQLISLNNFFAQFKDQLPLLKSIIKDNILGEGYDNGTKNKVRKSGVENHETAHRKD